MRDDLYFITHAGIVVIPLFATGMAMTSFSILTGVPGEKVMGHILSTA